MWSEHCSYKSSKIHLGKFPTEAPWVVCGPGRERRRGRHRRRPGRRLQDGEPQPPLVHRALPGGGDRRRRHPARRVHHGCAAGGAARRAALRRPGASEDPAPARPAWSPASAATATASACRPWAASAPSTAPTTATSWSTPCASASRAPTASSTPRPAASAIRWSMSAPRPAATASTAPPWPRPSSATRPRPSGPTVQVGDPFTEKLLIEACLELMEQDCIVAIQDMGAAGLTSSSFEMAARGEAGIELDLDRVPLRETGMTPYEIMLSESQERMLMVLEDGREAEALADLRQMGPGLRRDRPGDRHRPHGAALAGRGRGRRAGGTGQRRLAGLRAPRRAHAQARAAGRPATARPCCPHREALLRLLGSPDLASKRWIWEQYDHMVMGDTVQRPGGDAAVVRVHGTGRGLALTTDCTPRYCFADPRHGRAAGGGRGLAQPGGGRRPAAGDHQLPQFRQSRAAAGHGPAGRLHRGHGRGLPGARLPGRVRQRLALQRDRRQRDPAHAQCRRPGRDRRPRRAWSASPGTRAGPGAGPAGRVPGLARLLALLAASWSHRDDGAPPPVDLAAERRTGEFLLGQIAAGRVARLPRPVRRRPRRGRGRDVPGQRHAAPRSSSPATPRSGCGWWFGEDQGRYLLAVARRPTAARCWPRPARPACSPVRSAGPAATR